MSDNLVDRNHFSQLMCMYIDIGTETVLKVVYRLIPKDSVGQFLSNPETIQVLKGLKLKRALTSKEYTLLTTSNPNPDRFDISLLITLITLIPEADLPAPKNGWRSPPAHSDQSVAADLLRLRNIRNYVLCHRAKAELPEVRFEHCWREIEAILVRLIQQIHPEEETSLKERINSYRHRETDITKYLTLLDGWEKEINDIQKQVKAQLRKIAAYMKETPVRHDRYIKLLMEGGNLILSAFLHKKLDERGTCLRDFLEANEEVLKSVINDDSSWDKLYSNTEPLAQVDILLIAKLIRYGFKDLDSKDGEEIEKIQHARENYAEMARLSLDSDTFADFREDLIASLISLSRGLRKEVKTKLRKLIKECKSRHEDTNSSESETYIDRLRQKGVKIKTRADVIQASADYLTQNELHIKLLMEGGRLMLSAFLQTELNERGTLVREWLKENQELLRSVINDDSSWDELFSKSEHTAQLDTLLLVKVIRFGLKDLEREDKENLETIQNACEHYAEIARVSFGSHTLSDWLVLSNEARTKLHVQQIEKCKNLEAIDPSEPETYIDHLQQTRIKALADVHKETILELKNILTQMQNDGKDLERNLRFEKQLRTCTGEQADKKAEDELFKCIKENFQNVVDTTGLQTVRCEVKKILELIRGKDGVAKMCLN